MPSKQAKPARPAATLRLRLPTSRGLAPDKDVRFDLSVVEPVGASLFTASDETATVECLSRDAAGQYGNHVPERLSRFFTLPLALGEAEAGSCEQTKRGEVDIEGLAFDPVDEGRGYLWVSGSHSLARQKPKPEGDAVEECLARLTNVRRDPNRHLLGRIPCIRGEDDIWSLMEKSKRAGAPTLKAGALRMKRGWNSLSRLLCKDEHIGRFMGVPAKENGFDVEGVAAHGDRVWLGLRGPVLRGWAVIVEIAVDQGKGGKLKLRPIGPDGALYRKHFLDLDGLGIRDMKRDGDDLLLLAGPTMDLDGPVAVWRWPGGAGAAEETIVPRKQLRLVLRVPHGIGYDHAEGLALMPGIGGKQRLLIAYDNPGAARLFGAQGIDLDLFEMV